MTTKEEVRYWMRRREKDHKPLPDHKTIQREVWSDLLDDQKESSRFLRCRYPGSDAQVATADAKCPTSNDIAHIRQVMKISISELARVFDVSRQAVHEWIKGGALSPRNAQRVAALAQVADDFLNSGIDVTPQMLRRKIEGGQSLLDSVTGEGNVVEQARKLDDTLSHESQQRQRLAARLGRLETYAKVRCNVKD